MGRVDQFARLLPIEKDAFVPITDLVTEALLEASVLNAGALARIMESTAQ